MEILGWDPKVNETARTGTLRATVISMMGKSGDDAVALKAYNLFKSSLDDPDGSPVSGDLRESVYRCALRYDEEFVFNALKSKYEQTSFPEEQRDCLAIMGCVKDPKRHADMLDYVFISGKVRFQDFSIPLSSLASTTDNGGRAMWEYFKLNFEMLRSRFVSGPMWPVCVGICCYGMTSSSGADEVEAFFKNPRSPGSAAHRLSQALEVIRTKASSRERDRNAVAAFFQFKVW